MKVVALEDANLSLPELVELAKAGPVVLTRSGEPLVSVRDLSGSDWESASLAENPRFRAIIDESRRRYREDGGIGLDALRAELGLDGPASGDETPEGPTSAELEGVLRERMLAVGRTCQREMRWNPTTADRMIRDHGAVEAARRMVVPPDGSSGFARCWENGRLELSVEAVILDPIFAPLFTEDVLAIARDRLQQARNAPPRRA